MPVDNVIAVRRMEFLEKGRRQDPGVLTSSWEGEIRVAPSLAVVPVPTGTGATGSAGFWSNRLSSTLVASFFTPRPPLFAAGFLCASTFFPVMAGRAAGRAAGAPAAAAVGAAESSGGTALASAGSAAGAAMLAVGAAVLLALAAGTAPAAFESFPLLSIYAANNQ